MQERILRPAVSSAILSIVFTPDELKEMMLIKKAAPIY